MLSIFGRLLKRKTIAAPAPDQFAALSVLAAEAAATQDFPGAIRLYDQVIALNPSHAEACYKRGKALYRQKAVGDWNEVFARIATDLYQEFRSLAADGE
jgi:hypothetical protein